jgi:hypothetical protein
LTESNQVKIVLYEEDDDLYQLREKWEILLQKVPSAGIFLTWEWTIACWSIFGKDCQLFLLAAYEENELVGLAPLRISHKRFLGIHIFKTLEFIPGSPRILGADHLDIIAIPEKRSAIVATMLNYIIASSWDFLIWGSIPDISPNIVVLTRAFEKERITYDLKPAYISPYISLPDSWDEYFTVQCSAEYQRTVKRAIRNLERDHSTSIIRVDSPQDFSLGLSTLEDLHGERWGKKSLFRIRGFLPLHEEVARAFSLRGWLRSYFLIVNGEEVAALYGFRYGATFFYYQAGRKRDWESYSVGTILMAKVIQQELGQGAKEIDLGRGNEAYKFHWTSHFREDLQLTAYRSSWQTHLVHFTTNLHNLRAKLAYLKHFITSLWR